MSQRCVKPAHLVSRRRDFQSGFFPTLATLVEKFKYNTFRATIFGNISLHEESSKLINMPTPPSNFDTNYGQKAKFPFNCSNYKNCNDYRNNSNCRYNKNFQKFNHNHQRPKHNPNHRQRFHRSNIDNRPQLPSSKSSSCLEPSSTNTSPSFRRCGHVPRFPGRLFTQKLVQAFIIEIFIHGDDPESIMGGLIADIELDCTDTDETHNHPNPKYYFSSKMRNHIQDALDNPDETTNHSTTSSALKTL